MLLEIKEFDVIILGRKWHVKPVPPFHESLGKDNLGICNFVTNHIYVSNALSEQNYRHTLLHELTHAMIYEVGFDRGECKINDEERFCDLFGKALADVFTNIKTADVNLKDYEYLVNVSRNKESQGDSNET